MKEGVKTHKVVFLPSGKEVQVPPGSLLMEAAAQAGFLIGLPCGGQGRCGRCKVKLEQGEVSHRDNPHLTREQLQEGWVLSCTARVAGDLVIAIPPQEERERQPVATGRRAAPVRLEWPLYPAVRQLALELPPPSLEDNATDLERVSRALREELEVDRIHVSLPLLRRLSHTLRQGEWRVTAVVEMGRHQPEARLVDLHPGKDRHPLLGVAIDIGTTNVVLYLADLPSGRLIDTATMLNRQVTCGEDVISRIIYSLRGDGLSRLQGLVVNTINELLEEVTRRHGLEPSQVCDMVVAGNTTMIHLFLGIPPRHLREEPYIPTAVRFPTVRAAELGLHAHPQASVSCLPAVSAYVGGDITAGVVSSGLYREEKLALFLDVGTNGEMVLGNADWLMTDACSAGPAFEGAGIRHGMRAKEGAIEEVRISSLTLEPTLSVIGGGKPLGICGSGLISALAEMLLTGVVSRSGRIEYDYVKSKIGERCRARPGEHGLEFVLCWAQESGTGEDIVLTEVDINNLIRAKGAIYAGIVVMLRSVGVKRDSIEKVLIGGAFGQHIDVEEGIQIGLLPDLPWERFHYLGNTSALGAYNALLSLPARTKIEEVASKMTYLELIADNSFMNEFTAALFLPHTDLEQFPSVKRLLERMS